MISTQLPGSDIWVVHSEFGNILAGCFLERGIVSIGWGIGPIKHDDSKHSIVELLASVHSDAKIGTLQTWASEIQRFNEKMEVGDAVATYEPRSSMCHIGLLQSLLVSAELFPPTKHWNGCLKHDYVHRVEWLYEVPLDTLSEYTRKRIGLPMTLTRLNPQASAELRQHCMG